MILYVDACARKESRTRKLADDLLAKLGGDVEKVVLYNESLPTLDEAGLAARNRACASGDFSAGNFRYAKQFASADTIVIAAPFWDLSFPAILKKYIETICVVGITFRYSEQGFPVKPLLGKKVFSQLNDINFFMDRCTILNDTLAWDCAGNRDATKCIDIAPDTLYDLQPVKESVC